MKKQKMITLLTTVAMACAIAVPAFAANNGTTQPQLVQPPTQQEMQTTIDSGEFTPLSQAELEKGLADGSIVKDTVADDNGNSLPTLTQAELDKATANGNLLPLSQAELAKGLADGSIVKDTVEAQ